MFPNEIRNITHLTDTQQIGALCKVIQFVSGRARIRTQAAGSRVLVIHLMVIYPTPKRVADIAPGTGDARACSMNLCF